MREKKTSWATRITTWAIEITTWATVFTVAQVVLGRKDMKKGGVGPLSLLSIQIYIVGGENANVISHTLTFCLFREIVKGG